MTTALPNCPACGREWLRGLTWRHTTACPHYEPDSATAAADHDRYRGVRPMTDTERTLTDGYFAPPPAGAHLAVRFHHAGGVHAREVVERLDGRGNVTRPARRAGADDE